MISARPIWKLLDPAILVERCWDDLHVVYHCASGDTHLLNNVAAQVIQHLSEAPADSLTLAGRVAAALGVPSDHGFEVEIERLLTRFDELGLVEAVRR